MRKNLFRDWSKSDFGYALKIIANVALITAAVVYAECRQLLSVAKHYSRHRLFNRQFLYGILLFKFQKRYLYRKRALFCGFLSGYLHFQFI